MRANALCPMLSLATLAAFPAVARAADDVAANHPPEIAPRVEVRPAISDGSGGIDPVLRTGRTARVTFLAEDPDEEALTYAVASLPAGAAFDQQQGILTWRPTRDQEGKQEVRLKVSDGHSTASHTFTFFVTPNRAPADNGSEAVTYETVRMGNNAPARQREEAVYLATDPDADDVTAEIKQAPPHARIVVVRSSARLMWSPTSADIGEHELVVDVSDGELRTTIRKTIVVMPEWEGHEYRGWFLLGGGPTAFLSHGNGELFVGGTVDVTLIAVRTDGMGGYSCAHGIRTYDCHASHHRFYGQFEVLDSMSSGAASVFTYAAGYTASFEWRPARRHLIPHYGIDAGGLVRAGLGHRAQVHPYLGLHLWASDDIWVDATLGYRVTPSDLIDLSGPTFALRTILNPW